MRTRRFSGLPGTRPASMRRCLLATGLVALIIAACGGNGSTAPSSTVPEDGSSATTEPLTASPGSPEGSGATSTAMPASGTLPRPVVGSTEPGATNVTAAAQPGVTITALTGGDPATFCSNLDLSFPASFVISLAGSDDPATEGVAEVAMAPILRDPLSALAASAPRELVGPFVVWDDRNAKALKAFETIGASDAALSRYVTDLRAELKALQAGTSDGAAFDDLAATAARAGFDRARLESAGKEFASSYGSFDDFFDQFSLDITLDPVVERQLVERFPCAADLASTDG